MRLVHERLVEEAARDARLVGDDHDREAGAVEQRGSRRPIQGNSCDLVEPIE